ncbi:hypothetical protein CLOBOL_01162 [Enterocloster bolteae ATCC BAA-613]|uniref:Uncharacterized protein n=1 Tax=Enterocloster bolteae (strain ATCC BAA-613 / DSM 15670 / CCUG 46953 / JCM 12243 / WAL 16351) TaxID=411902 RepID=A8RJC0_ENTBW|nr:hypothetical protein CLOBOL_01162 [Enterocloster bolteae ATCC BAA-613]
MLFFYQLPFIIPIPSMQGNTFSRKNQCNILRFFALFCKFKNNCYKKIII